MPEGEQGNGQVEERVDIVDVPNEAATGRRWQFSVAMVVVGVLVIVAGIVLATVKHGLSTLCAVLGGGGVVLILVFGLVAAGSERVGIAASKDGVDAGASLPRTKRVRTRFRKRGLDPKPEPNRAESEDRA
jgi:hypothetical protein